MERYKLVIQNDYIELIFFGDITIEDSLEIKEEVKAKLDELKCDVIVNLADVVFMDSSGLGMLISFFKEVNEYHGKIIYFGIHDYIKRLLSLVKLDQIFMICDSRESAIAKIKD